MTTATGRARLRQQQVLGRTAASPPPRPTLRRHALDVSNYTDPLTVGKVEEWAMDHDVGLVIVQAVDPPPPYPPGVTAQQLNVCVAAGMPVDVYLYLWTHSNVEQDMRSKLALLNGREHNIRRLWLDVEDTADATAAQRIGSIRQAFAVLDGWSAAHGKPLPGLYTGRWWWVVYVADTHEFSDRALWTSQYDYIEDARVFIPYGGWKRCAIKQYAGSSVLAGIGGVDLNVLSDAELIGAPKE